MSLRRRATGVCGASEETAAAIAVSFRDLQASQQRTVACTIVIHGLPSSSTAVPRCEIRAVLRVAPWRIALLLAPPPDWLRSRGCVGAVMAGRRQGQRKAALCLPGRRHVTLSTASHPQHPRGRQSAAEASSGGSAPALQSLRRSAARPCQRDRSYRPGARHVTGYSTCGFTTASGQPPPLGRANPR